MKHSPSPPTTYHLPHIMKSLHSIEPVLRSQKRIIIRIRTRIHRSELKSFHTLQQTEFMLLFTIVNIHYTKIVADIS